MYLGLSDETSTHDDFWYSTYTNLGLSSSDHLKKVLAYSPAHRGAIAQLPSHGRILDAGCGLGVLSLLNPYLTNEIVGIDASPGMIQRAKELSPQGQFQMSSLTSLPFPEESFDNYVAIASLELVREGLSLPLKEAFRVLKKGGRFFAITMRLQPDYFFTEPMEVVSTLGRFHLQKVDEAPHPFPPNGHAYWYTPCELKTALKDVGFSNIHLSCSDLLGGLCYSHLTGKHLKGPLSKVIGNLMREGEESTPPLWKKVFVKTLLQEEGILSSLLSPIRLCWSYWNVIAALKN